MKTILLIFLLAVYGFGWQQEVHYTIQVTLDTQKHTLTGREQITYRNHSPDTLDCVWIHLYPNAYRNRKTVFGRELEQMQSYGFSFAAQKERGYSEIDSLTVDGGAAQFEIRETEMKVELPRPLAAGDSIELEIQFSVKIPGFFSRLGHTGKHYEFTQWYPKMVVYDHYDPSVRKPTDGRLPSSGQLLSAGQLLSDGRFASEWHPDGYHAIGEFYGEFGTFDVSVTVPANMMVGATGVLVEPRGEADWMRKPLKERKTTKPDSLKTLTFHAENVHDFAWVADADYVLLSDSLNGITINVLARHKSEKDWRKVTDYAKDALRFYSQWYGPYPYAQLTVAQGSFPAGGGMEYPNLVIISAGSPSWMRGLETVVIHEICHQWFYGILGSNEMAETWLDEGITTFSEMRYLETKYGSDNYFNWPRSLQYLPNTSDRYYHKLVYRIAATNHLEKPILTPAFEFVDNPIAYAAVEYSKAGLVMEMLRGRVGESTFDKIMQRYYEDFKFRHPTTGDFIATAEAVTGSALGRFFEEWLTTTHICDYSITKVKSTRDQTRVTICRRGDIIMPVEVMVISRNGDRQIQEWDGNDRNGVINFETRSPVKQVILDPNSRLLEIDRWNNYYPRKIEIQPVFNFPSLDAYQFFYCPYLWYNGSDGLEVGAWLQGRRFIDYDFLKGEHQWGASIVYCTGSRSWKPGFSYQTPLPLFDRRLRLRLGGYNSRLETNLSFGFNGKFGPVLKLPAYEFNLDYQFNQLKDLRAKDTADWDLAKTGLIKMNLSHSFLSRCWRGQEQLNFILCDPGLGGDAHRYTRLSAELNQTVRLSRSLRCNLRFFGGTIWGTAPAQNQFFLSGSLLPTGSEPLTIAYEGFWATQEHWHIAGDGNLRGYAGGHQRGKTVAAFNFSISGLPVPVKPFFDVGNIGDGSIDFRNLKADGGFGVNVGPLYADFPIWVSTPGAGESHIKFRWLLGISLALGFSIL
jgi:hypothetical protein